MLSRLKIPKTILWVINTGLVLFALFFIFRFITFFAFKPPGISFDDCVPSFALGVQYDLRWISIFLLPVILFSYRRSFSPFYSARNKRIWTWYLAIVTFLLFLFFIADMVSFSYNRTRLDAGAMNFVEDPGISLNMIWQTYPLVWILVGLAAAIICFKWALNKSHWQVINLTDGKAIMHRRFPFVIAAIVLGLFIYGKMDSTPLKWKDSFALKDSFKTYLALNPLQNFFSTMRFREPVINEKGAREAFPLMADFLQFPPRAPFGFKRTVAPHSTGLESKPNVVLVICESYSMYKSSMSGNVLNASPYFDSLSRKGIFFERCFTPHFSTARGLFAILTGTPDVQLFKFSTRNPEAIDQNTIINNFTDYSKHYFLGGDPEFNNFEGLLMNISNLQLHTEQTIPAPRINVWGISDKDLFMAANNVFKAAKQPFFAIIQTSDNHRPYTIPATDRDFEKKNVSKDSLLANGFESLEEYNTFRYADYSIRKFIESAAREPYFHNTIFAFIGDHGVAGNATSVYPAVWTTHRLSDEHVPFLIYAPYLVAPQLRKETVSQIDVLPTIAGLLQRPYDNFTLGRDLLAPDKKGNLAFITNTAGRIGIVNDQFYYVKSLDFAEEDLTPIDTTINYPRRVLDSARKKMSALTNAYYQTAQYLLLNNKQMP
ncbi:LTA synthase family protein [Niabella drilacis]|uniref:Phosphoglycerol transferase MdoB n=1 Tax=Niabella drilacis (strain DSM 25811 / CCM 8410 / CCUG 62505 / LMG 26954 / E90) TaxID=1285928 RepID=A0A1G6Z6R0_NIADE|nr:alkaline phosphatase family protein [Niabella drilacis]SDD97555.1 Phosphoglycerol transferase MdoB [Niabella drilacis]